MIYGNDEKGSLKDIKTDFQSTKGWQHQALTDATISPDARIGREQSQVIPCPHMDYGFAARQCIKENDATVLKQKGSRGIVC
jgi:hypothetical protein